MNIKKDGVNANLVNYMSKKIIGHLFALFSIVMWGITFIFSQQLLPFYSPIEIMLFRFVIAFFCLWITYPKIFKLKQKKQEIFFILAGLIGNALYTVFEVSALSYTTSANVAVITSISPFFTAVFTAIILKSERITKTFIIGFMVCIFGIVLVSYNGTYVLKLNPLGDTLAFLSAICWGLYAVILKKITEYNYNIILATRRIFFYGILFTIPMLLINRDRIDLVFLTKFNILSKILFLGIIASALCFVTFNKSIDLIGAIKTSIYMYAIPVITIIAAYLILKETINFIAGVGTLLTLSGLYISNLNTKKIITN